MKNEKLTKGLLVLVLYILIPLILNNFLPSLTDSNAVSIIIRLVVDIGLIITFIMIYKEDFKKYTQNFKSNKTKIVLTSLLFAFLAFVGMIVSTGILNALSIKESTNNLIITHLYGMIPMYMMFQTIIYVPIIENIVFRKVFKDNIKNTALFILTSGLVYGIYHIIYNVSSPIEILQMLPYVVTGIIYAWAYKKTDNIYTPIFATFLYALVVFLINLA